MRLIVANLDCETDFAVDAGAPPFQLPRAVLQRISAAGTLLGVFGRPEDALWTPLAVDPKRMGAGLSQRPRVMVSGSLARVPRPSAVLAWGESRAVAALRPAGAAAESTIRAAPGAMPEATKDALEAAGAGDDAWPARLWTLSPDPDAARRCNDRRFCLALRRDLGSVLPGTAMLESVEELAAHLAAGGAAAGHRHTWVLKAPFSASGRLRLRRRGATLDEASRARARRLFGRFGALCFEPWVARVLDFGCLGLVAGPGRWTLLPPHRLETDDAGVFRGIVIGPEEDGAWLDAQEQRAVVHAATAAARALGDAGYRGAFGIDGFGYQLLGDGAAGARRLLPMCEINARSSFGLVAHALARSHGADSVCLRLGAGPVPEGAEIVPLLHPGTEDDTSAWLELLR